MIPQLFAALFACAAAPEEVPPEVALADVRRTLADVGTTPGASAWTRAWTTFDRDLAPGLRRQLDPSEVAALEYAFGQLRADLDAGRPTADRLSRLAAEIDLASRKAVGEVPVATR